MKQFIVKKNPEQIRISDLGTCHIESMITYYGKGDTVYGGANVSSTTGYIPTIDGWKTKNAALNWIERETRHLKPDTKERYRNSMEVIEIEVDDE